MSDCPVQKFVDENQHLLEGAQPVGAFNLQKFLENAQKAMAIIITVLHTVTPLVANPADGTTTETK